MIEFLTYTIVSLIILITSGLLIINALLKNVKNNLEELHKYAKEISDKE